MAADEFILEMEGVNKSYPGVQALEDVAFDLRQGEVHVLLGENGAGKSTLMKILSGSVKRDTGRIVINGQEVKDIDPERSQELGIGMVYQELSLVPSLSVAENMFLGHLPRSRWGTVDWRETHERARSNLKELGVKLDPRTLVRELDVAEQQLTEIARVLAYEPRILLLDEPTSALSDEERERLFQIIRNLRGHGVSVVYISHRLAEVSMVGDRVTVLRDGRRIDTLPVERADEDTLVKMLVGRELEEQFPKSQAGVGQPILRVENLNLEGRLHDISFELRQGEILGVFGLMGAGQPDLARAVFGLEPKATAEIYVDENKVKIEHPSDAIRHGIGYLTRDRREGLVPMLPVAPNITLAGLSQKPMLNRLQLRSERETAARYVRDLDIDTPSLNQKVIYLSGGNQQKVVLARWLASESKILIFDEPTRGIDVGAKAEVFTLMEDLTEEGVGIVMISSEMNEIMAMADRILVMRAGTFSGEFEPADATQEKLLRAAS
ncbi:MAG: sugar ABC transporter ATP-binding protein [Anaerolineales bacterium]|nr:sugar ABC transporter ATP-binding protein [Anaerolineales bacterium]